MSYILDALKRAERERKHGQVSVLDELPSTPAIGAAPQRRLPLGLLAASIALLAVTLLAWLLLGRHHAAPVLAGQAQAPGAATAPGPRLLPAPPQQQAEAPPPPAPAEAQPQPPAAASATIEDSGKIATLDDVAPAAPPPPTPGAEGTLPRLRGRPEPPPGMTADGRGGPPRPPGAEQRDAAPPDAGGAPPEAPPAEAAAQPPSMPAQRPAPAQPVAADGQPLKEMPENYRASFPSFAVDVHVYNDNPQKRFILVGGKRYHEGDTMAEGPRIVAIVPEGLVLDWQGQQVLYAINR